MKSLTLSHLVKFSYYLLRHKLLEVMPEFKSVDGHNFCASPLPLIPGEERKMTEAMRILPLFFHRDDEQTIPGSLVLVAVLPFVTLSIA